MKFDHFKKLGTKNLNWVLNWKQLLSLLCVMIVSCHVTRW